jgi:osomolarity two-component system sensor histidine kinase NIK1
MQGDIWVESEVGKGSKFYFTITSQTNEQQSLDSTLLKLSPFSKRTILFVDTMHDSSGVKERIAELGLLPVVVHDVGEVADKEKCPHIDTIIVDSLPVVRLFSSKIRHAAHHYNLQTENLREYEHLRYIPIALLAPSLPRLNSKLFVPRKMFLLTLYSEMVS